MKGNVNTSTSKYWLPRFLAGDSSLSADGKRRLEGAIRTLESDGVDIALLYRLFLRRKTLRNGKPSTILSEYSSADQRRIKALPRNLRATAAVLKKPRFDFFLRWGAQRCPGLIETLNHLSHSNVDLFPMRNGCSRGDFFLKLPEILEDLAQAIENTLKRPPQPRTLAMYITSLVGKVAAESRSKRAHYQEILDILDPEGNSPVTYDGLKNLVARERTRQKTRSRPPRENK
jgi:hypothetical protein